MIRAVIVDDEEKSRKLLRNLLQSYCKDVDVVALEGSARSGAEAVRREKPDLLFLDVVMPNETGFDLLDRISDISCDVIFTTAYDQYAIKALRACALDYLLKPIDFEELVTAVERVREKNSGSAADLAVDQRLATLLENYRLSEEKPHKIGFPTQNGVKFYLIDRIYFCKAEGNYTSIYLEGREKLELVSKTLKEFEDLLAEHSFIRTHRSYLVNLKHLKEYRRFGSAGADGEGGCVVMANNLLVPVSRDKRKMLLERISRPF